MYKILSSTASCDSAMKLRDAIEELLGWKNKTILVSKDSGQCSGHRVLLRYGCGYGKLETEPEWNSPQFVNFCIDKLQFSQAFEQSVPTPKFLQSNAPDGFPVLVRETLTGAKSEGVHVCHNRAEFDAIYRPGYWWTKFFHADFEIRVLLAISDKNYFLRIYKKVPREDVQKGEDFVVAGENTSWVLKDEKFYPKVVAIAKKMIPDIYKRGGRFVGLDMIYVPELKDYVVLEGNSGPWLSTPAAKWLAGVFLSTQWSKYQE